MSRIESFSMNRLMHLVLDGVSDRLKINAGIPHVPILSPTLFLIYINEIFFPCHLIPFMSLLMTAALFV